MKARYYPEGHLLDTVFPQSTSVTCQGIMHGLDPLKTDIIWRVVDGASINIWRDNWLPRNSDLELFEKNNISRLKWVSELFLGESRKWDENLIRDLFYPHVVEEILRLRI